MNATVTIDSGLLSISERNDKNNFKEKLLAQALWFLKIFHDWRPFDKKYFQFDTEANLSFAEFHWIQARK